MTDKEALKLALEALETCDGGTSWADPYQRFDKKLVDKAIKAIKQTCALDRMAENAKELGLDYEPVPENFIDALKFDVAVRDAAPVLEPHKVLSEHLAQATNGRVHVDPVTGNVGIGTPAAPVQEPIGYLFQHEETGLTTVVDVQQVEWGFEKNNPRHQKIGPVYTTPPAAQRQWVGLTVLEQADCFANTEDATEFYHAIEAKLKERNQ